MFAHASIDINPMEDMKWKCFIRSEVYERTHVVKICIDKRLHTGQRTNLLRD